jgi:high-affinity nickel-transport protein
METAATGGLGLGLVISAVLLGLRHGVDWDHIAAITDIAATQDTRRRGFVLSTLYVLGHAAVVFVLGVIAIVVGRNLPGWADALMGRMVGFTLLILGGYVVYSLVRHRGQVRLQSRWMLLISGIRRIYRRGRGLLAATETSHVEHDHAHAAVVGYHHDDELVAEASPSPVGSFRAPTHRHSHRHSQDVAFESYGTKTSLGVGMLHGIGAETPTQVVVFLAAANAGGSAGGLIVLMAFLVGLVAANTGITLAATSGFFATSGRKLPRIALASVTAVVSLVVGVLLVTGQDTLLPAFFAG